jgi:hypothetical protein
MIWHSHARDGIGGTRLAGYSSWKGIAADHFGEMFSIGWAALGEGDEGSNHGDGQQS